MIEIGSQICIGLFTISGVWLLARSDMDLRKELRAWTLMLLAQGFWLHSTWSASQWGMFLVSVTYTAIALEKVISLTRRLRGRRWP